MKPDVIREAVAQGRVSAEHGAQLLELHYELNTVLRRARWRRRIKRWLTAPVRWLCRRD